MIRRALILGLAVLLAGIWAGCGGDSSADEGGTEPREVTPVSVEEVEDLSKAELLAQADKICEATDAKQERALKAYLQKHPKAASNPQGQAAMVEAAGLPAIGTEIEELEALGAPEGEGDRVTRVFEAIAEALREGEERPSTLLGNSVNPFEKAGRLAAAYGFNACSNAL